MFGHQDDKSPEQDTSTAPQVPQDDSADAVITAVPSMDAAGSPAGDPAWQHPGMPTTDSNTEASGPVISPAGGFPKAPSFPTSPNGEGLGPVPELEADTPAPAHPTDDDMTHELIDIKQHALNELLPLIDKLDQPPAEKFRTLLMMIQASDDPHLIKAAYESAHNIDDEKVRARALLDIVNEINYFTQQPPAQN